MHALHDLRQHLGQAAQTARILAEAPGATGWRARTGTASDSSYRNIAHMAAVSKPLASAAAMSDPELTPT